MSGDVAILGFAVDVVDANHQSVPLDEVYIHHWLVFDGKGNAGTCRRINYKFGVGAECRNSHVRYKDGYGQVLYQNRLEIIF